MSVAQGMLSRTVSGEFLSNDQKWKVSKKGQRSRKNVSSRNCFISYTILVQKDKNCYHGQAANWMQMSSAFSCPETALCT